MLWLWILWNTIVSSPKFVLFKNNRNTELFSLKWSIFTKTTMIQLQQDIKSKIKVFFNETRNHLTVTAYPAISLIINHLPLQSHFRKARAPTTAIDSYFLGRSSMGSRADIGRYTVQRCATIYIHTPTPPRLPPKRIRIEWNLSGRISRPRRKQESTKDWPSLGDPFDPWVRGGGPLWWIEAFSPPLEIKRI